MVAEEETPRLVAREPVTDETPLDAARDDRRTLFVNEEVVDVATLWVVEDSDKLPEQPHLREDDDPSLALRFTSHLSKFICKPRVLLQHGKRLERLAILTLHDDEIRSVETVKVPL